MKIEIPNTIKNNDFEDFWKRSLSFLCSHFNYVVAFDSNQINYPFDGFEKRISFGNTKIVFSELDSKFDQIKKEIQSDPTEFVCFLSYDLKNELEELSSENQDFLFFPDAFLMQPEGTIYFSDLKVTIVIDDTLIYIFEKFENQIFNKNHEKAIFGSIFSRFTKQEYIETVLEIKQHIRRGDFYELNFCSEYFIENIEIDPISIFLKLNEISPMPFASFMKYEDRFILCASPERFIKKSDLQLISQPIKGTIKRGKTEEEDKLLKESLLNSEKERAENVMIVDLVRNDLSHTAKDGSVKVKELYGIYSFAQVHQMISTVEAIQSKSFHFLDTIKNCFPMGSMTGAPKISAMKWIEKYEKTKRGAFSGSLGYITSNGNYDFNVIIRSILYNQSNKYLSFQVGSAITIDSDPEKEWEECYVKSSAIRKVLTSL